MSTLTVILIDGPSQAELQGCVPEMTLWGAVLGISSFWVLQSQESEKLKLSI